MWWKYLQFLPAAWWLAKTFHSVAKDGEITRKDVEYVISKILQKMGLKLVEDK